FVAAKALKYWAIASLGVRWTFRVLVPPGSSRTARGPYQWLRHPNYVAVGGELAGIGLVMHAWYTGGPAIVFFCVLMLRRVAVTERAGGAVQEKNRGRGPDVRFTRRFFRAPWGVGGRGAAVGPADLFAARGREALTGLSPWERDAAHVALAGPNVIRLSSNE